MGFKVWFPEKYDKTRPIAVKFAMLDDTDGHTIEIPDNVYSFNINIEDENGDVIYTDTVKIIGNSFFDNTFLYIYAIPADIIKNFADMSIRIFDDLTTGSVWFFKRQCEDYRVSVFGTGRILVNQDWGDQTTPMNWAGGWINKDGITAIRDVLVYAVDESGVITDSAYSDENGNWSLSLRPGNYVIKFRKYGYTFLDRQVIVE